jgi:hypothetical protein
MITMKTYLTVIMSLMTTYIGFQFHVSPNRDSWTLASEKQDSSRYRVYKIDSINDYYLIYARRGHSIFKIVSKKERTNKCSGIVVDDFYKFRLHSMMKVNGRSIIPANEIMELSGWRIDNSTTVNFEGDSIRDLYYGDNIKGLCFIKKNQ